MQLPGGSSIGGKNYTDKLAGLRAPKHQHSFSIPVEWEYKGVAAEWRHADKNWPMPQAKRVTKLRCSGCSEEVKRG